MRKPAISILSILTGIILGAGTAGKASSDRIKKVRSLSDKHLALFLMMNRWVKVKQEGIRLSSYFEKNGYARIAIYGMSYAGETLMEELRDTGITVAYGIDQRAGSVYSDVEVVSADDDLDLVDAVVVTAITYFDEIEEKLTGKIGCPIISLEDILYEI